MYIFSLPTYRFSVEKNSESLSAILGGGILSSDAFISKKGRGLKQLPNFLFNHLSN